MGSRPNTTRPRRRSARTSLLTTTAVFKEQRGQWRQRQGQRVTPPVQGHRNGIDPAKISPTASPIECGVAVEHFLPESPARNAHAIIRPWHRREITDDEQQLIG